MDWKRVYNREYKPPITDFSDLQDEEEDEIDATMKGGKVLYLNVILTKKKLNYKILFLKSKKNVFNDSDYDEQNVRVNRVIKFSFSKEI